MSSDSQTVARVEIQPSYETIKEQKTSIIQPLASLNNEILPQDLGGIIIVLSINTFGRLGRSWLHFPRLKMDVPAASILSGLYFPLFGDISTLNRSLSS